MAKKATVELQVLLKASGIKATTEQVDNLRNSLKQTAMANADSGKASKKAAKSTKEQTTATKNLTKAQNQQKRAAEGVSNRANRQGKDNARMMQGMGGLVGAYATIVGNIYALSTAFLVLRNSADLSSMMKSAEDFSNRFGRSVQTITKDMQKATGGALSFAEALPSINKAIAGGFSTNKIKELSIAATKASQTFGGTANEALSRFISAAQRGRTEIVQTLGIVIQTEKVYTEYAASIGKAKDQLNAFDKQQAIVNAIIEESQNVFDGVNIDPNPFTQFANTIEDLKDTILTTLTDAFTPFINLINKSEKVALAAMGGIAGMIVKKLLPAAKDFAKASMQAGRDSSQLAIKAATEARKKVEALEAMQSKTTKVHSKKDAGKVEENFKKSLEKRKKIHGSFTKSIIKQNGEMNIAVLTEQRSALKRQENAILKGRGIMKGLPSELAVIRKQRVALDQIAASVEGGNIQLAKKEAALKSVARQHTRFFARTKRGWTRYRANVIGVKSQLKSGFGRAFNLAQSDMDHAVLNMKKSWAIWSTSVEDETQKASKSWKRFGLAFGKTAGVVAAKLANFANYLGIIMFVVTGAVALWNKYKDAIRGITPAVREFLDTQKEMPARMDEINKRTALYIEQVGGEIPDSMVKMGSSLDFVSGSLTSVTDELNKLRVAFKTAVGGAETIEQAGAEIDSMKAQVMQLREILREETTATAPLAGMDMFDISGYVPAKVLTDQGKATKDELENLEKKLKGAQYALDNFGSPEALDSMVSTLATVSKQARIAGMDTQFVQDKISEFIGTKLPANFDKDGILYKAILGGDPQKIETAIRELTGVIDPEQLLPPEDFENIINLVSSFTKDLGGATANLNITRNALEETNKAATTFFQNYERNLISRSGGNKQFVKLILDAKNRLVELNEAAKDNARIKEVIEKPEEFQDLKAIVGFKGDEGSDFQAFLDKAKSTYEEILAIERDAITLERSIAQLKFEQQKEAQKISITDEQRVNALDKQQEFAKRALYHSQQQVIVDQRRLEKEVAIAQATLLRAEATGDTTRIELAVAELEFLEFNLGILNQQVESHETINALLDRRHKIEDQLLLIENIKFESLARTIFAQGKIALLKNKIIKSDAQELSNLKQRQKYQQDISKNRIDEAAADLATAQGNRMLDKVRDSQIQKAKNALDLAIQNHQQLTERQAQERNILELKQEQKDLTVAVTKAQQESLLAANQLVKSDKARIEILKRQQAAAAAKAALAIHDLHVAMRLALVQADSNSDRDRIATTYKAQIDAQTELLEIMQKTNQFDLANELLSGQVEVWDNAIAILEVEKEISATKAQQVYSIENQAKHARTLLNNLDAQYIYQSAKLIAERDSLEQIKENNDEAERGIADIQSKLDLLKEQYLLEKEILKLNDEARNAEVDGGIFNKNAIDLSFRYFNVKAKEAALALEPIFKTIGDGFYDTVVGTFDTAVKNLLEGGENFAETVREALKASLRDVVGKAIKNATQSNIAGISQLFNKKTAEDSLSDENKANQARVVAELSELKKNLGNIPMQDAANKELIDNLPKVSKILEEIKAQLAATPDTDTDVGGGSIMQANATIISGIPDVNKNLVSILNVLQGLPPIDSPKYDLDSTKAIEGKYSSVYDKANNPFSEIKTINKATLSTPQASPVPDSGIKQLVGTMKGGLGVTIGDPVLVSEVENSPSIESELQSVDKTVEVTGKDTKEGIIGALVNHIGNKLSGGDLGAEGGGGFWTGVMGAATSFFADGGIMTGRSSGLVPLAAGGIVNSPMAALVGEGKNSEAVVPLPNNREIPVDMKGQTGDTINIEQNFDFTNANAGSVAQLRTEARAIEDRTFNRVFSEINKGGKYAKIVGRR